MGTSFNITRACSETLLLAAWLLAGCAGPQKFDPNAAITIRSGGLGNTYEQGGKSLDNGDMLDKLSERPPSQADADAAKTLAIVAGIIGATGGALIGWPIGAAAAGSKDPPWLLAGIGAGVVVVSIPFSIASGNRVERAAESHNRALGAPKQPETKP